MKTIAVFNTKILNFLFYQKLDLDPDLDSMNMNLRQSIKATLLEHDKRRK
jgi:hypothetical protein